LQTIEDAKDYFKRKVEFLIVQIEKVQAVGREKSTVRSGKFHRFIGSWGGSSLKSDIDYGIHKTDG
jgi:hypothetical protein